MSARASRPTWAGFVLWALIGAAFMLAFFTLTTLFLIPLLVGVIVLAVRPSLLASGSGLVAGVGLVSMYVAFVQRRGPGTVCWETATASGCDEYLNPWPWLVVGVALVAIGVIAHTRRTRPQRSGSHAVDGA